MTAHTCKTLDPNCYRCNLNNDEMKPDRMTDTNEDKQDKMVEDYYIQPNVEIPFFPHNGDRDKSFYAASDWAWANKAILGVFYHISDTGDGWKIELHKPL